MVRASRGKSAALIPNAFLSFTLIPFITRFFTLRCFKIIRAFICAYPTLADIAGAIVAEQGTRLAILCRELSNSLPQSITACWHHPGDVPEKILKAVFFSGEHSSYPIVCRMFTAVQRKGKRM
jgi:hypothetical protein